VLYTSGILKQIMRTQNPICQTPTLPLRKPQSDLSSPAFAFRGRRSCPLTFVCCASVRFRCTGFRAMMQRVGAADLRPCSCPGGLKLLRGHKVSRSSNAQKTCMKANTFQVEVHPLQAPKRKHESSFSLCHNLIVVNTAHISPASEISTLGLTLLFLTVQIDVPEGIPVDEVMKRFKNESRRVNTVGEVSYIGSACVTTTLLCLP